MRDAEIEKECVCKPDFCFLLSFNKLTFTRYSQTKQIALQIKKINEMY